MNWFDTFAEQFAVYGYPVLFAGVLLENAGIPVPGETAVLVAGFLSSPAGGSHFKLLWVILLTLVAAVVGDNVGFWLGHRYARPRLQAGRSFLFLTPKTLKLVEGYFERYGVWTIFFQRFITGIRVVGAVAAGTAGMPWARFLVANAGGALAWSVTMSLLGYFFGHSWELLHKWLGRGGLIILGSVVILIGLPYLLRRLRKMHPLLWDKLAKAQVWQHVLVAALEVVCVGLLVRVARSKPNPDRPTRFDQPIVDWINEHSMPALDLLAAVGTWAGSLLIVAGVAGLLMFLLWHGRRSWREFAALIWTVVASEVVGLLLIALLRSRDIESARPFWFEGVIPLRAVAVFGMGAVLISRQNRAWSRVAWISATMLILFAGFGVVWSQTQYLSEAFLEYAAGGLILFAGLWWLEGYGPGWVSSLPSQEQVSTAPSSAAAAPAEDGASRAPATGAQR